MNLEVIEQRCFLLLSSTENPLVPFETLMAHLRQDPECASIGPDELVEFFKDHALFNVVEPLTASLAGSEADMLVGADATLSRRVILKTRIPTPSDLAKQMDEELDALAEALGRAMEEFKRRHSDRDIERTRTLLERVETLREKVAGAHDSLPRW